MTLEEDDIRRAAEAFEKKSGGSAKDAREPPTPEKLFVDLGAIIANGLEPERPGVARLSPERCMLYKGRINEIHSEPGVGKTNLALCFALAVIKEGGHVLFIDPEDTPSGILARLNAFGADMQMVVESFHYLHNPTPAEFEAAILWAAENRPALVILDGLAEALAAEGKNEDKVGDVLSFFVTGCVRSPNLGPLF